MYYLIHRFDVSLTLPKPHQGDFKSVVAGIVNACYEEIRLDWEDILEEHVDGKIEISFSMKGEAYCFRKLAWELEKGHLRRIYPNVRGFWDITPLPDNNLSKKEWGTMAISVASKW